MSDNPVTPDTKSYPYPSDRIWFDPRLILANCSILQSDVAIPMTTNKMVAPARSNRWAIGMFQPTTITQCSYAPWPDVDAFVVDITSLTNTIKWFKLFDYGPLVANSWWVRGSSAFTLRVVEILRN